MAEYFDTPPVLQGDELQQLQTLYSFLYTMSEKLNTAMSSISADQLAPETRQQLQSPVREDLEKQRESLKSIIVKTAEIVDTEMDEIRSTLQTRTQAISEQFGSIETILQNEITARADGLTQAFNYIEQLNQAAAGSAEFKRSFTSYINIGVIRYEDGVPVTGIAIGKDITNPDGTINQNNRMATFTADRLSFWQNNTEIAYFSNNTLHVASVEVFKTLKMGIFTWTLFTDGALALLAGQ